MKTQHTQGEWRVFELPKPEGFENKLRILAPTLKESYVAVIPTGPSVRKPYNESLANAKLIAAAPDLLEALNNLVGFLESYEPYFSDGKSMSIDIPIPQAINAIQKATN